MKVICCNCFGTLASGSSNTEFSMQLNARKNLMSGAGFATSDSDNGLFVFVKR